MYHMYGGRLIGDQDISKFRNLGESLPLDSSWGDISRGKNIVVCWRGNKGLVADMVNNSTEFEELKREDVVEIFSFVQYDRIEHQHKRLYAA